MLCLVSDGHNAAASLDPATHVLRNPGVVGIGLGSLLSDTGHEIATAAVPAFLRSLGAPAAALGAIEGVADAALSASKVAGGVVADRPGVERKTVTAGGYAITALGHGAFGLANVWPVVAAARAVSWVARGGKAPARDSLLAGSVEPEQLGRAFGVERAMDSLGAIAGPLLAAPLIVAVGYRWLFAISVIPGLLAALAVLVLVREVPRVVLASAELAAPMRTLLRTPGPFRRLLAGVGLYGLGNFSATLLILRATQLLHEHGRSNTDAAAVAVLLYAAPQRRQRRGCVSGWRSCGSDRSAANPRRRCRAVRWHLCCVRVRFGQRCGVLAALFVAVGASTALVETGEGAHASELLDPAIRGRGFGLLGLVDGVGDLVSSVVVGVLFTVTRPAWGFIYAAALAAAGGLVLIGERAR